MRYGRAVLIDADTPREEAERTAWLHYGQSAEQMGWTDPPTIEHHADRVVWWYETAEPYPSSAA